MYFWNFGVRVNFLVGIMYIVFDDMCIFCMLFCIIIDDKIIGL